MKEYLFLKRSYNRIIDRIVSQDTDSINQARIKMLFWGLSANLVFIAISIFIYLFFGPALQLIRSLITFAVGLSLVIAVIKWPIWRQVSHAVLIVMTLVIWSNLFLYVQDVSISTMQFVFLIVVYSFYVHGLRWGVFYSILTAASIILYIGLRAKNYFVMPMKPQAINRSAYIFVICYNFLLIIFLHYHFFKSFIQNIRELKKAGNEQKILNSKLQQAMDDLAKSSEAKMNFLSTMSHELRTPLNGVIGLSNVLLLNDPREDQKDNLGILKFSAENLLALINDILDFNKLDSGKINLEEHPTNLIELLNKIAGGMRLKAVEKGIDFNLKVDPVLEDKLIICDSTRLTQILLNLANNAVKFTNKGSVEVIAEVLGITGDKISIQFIVKDTGIGIPEQQQSAIFDPFTQAHSNITRQFGGTGLGLAIVKNLLNVQGSEICLVSEEGKGADFSFKISYPFTLGLKKLSEEVTENPQIELSEIKILVAEDNPINVMVIKKLLALCGNIPEVATNGVEALRIFKENYFDLILMDLHMPETDGYEATRLIRKLEDEEKAQVPIMALTASVSEDVIMKVREAGMNDYLSKPFNPHHLYEKIEKLVGSNAFGKKIQ